MRVFKNYPFEHSDLVRRPFTLKEAEPGFAEAYARWMKGQDPTDDKDLWHAPKESPTLEGVFFGRTDWETVSPDPVAVKAQVKRWAEISPAALPNFTQTCLGVLSLLNCANRC